MVHISSQIFSFLKRDLKDSVFTEISMLPWYPKVKWPSVVPRAESESNSKACFGFALAAIPATFCSPFTPALLNSLFFQVLWSSPLVIQGTASSWNILLCSLRSPSTASQFLSQMKCPFLRKFVLTTPLPPHPSVAPMLLYCNVLFPCNFLNYWY